MSIKRILAALLAMTIMNISSVTVLAATDTKRTEPGSSRPAWGQKHVDRFEELLEAGVVSQSTYDKIKAFLDENMQKPSARPERWNTLDKLLQAGIITQTEHDALLSAMASPAVRPEGMGEAQKSNPFSRFVTDGLITEETAAVIMEYLAVNRPQKTQHVDILSKMLDDGVITQDEYDDIKASMPESSARTHAMAG